MSDFVCYRFNKCVFVYVRVQAEFMNEHANYFWFNLSTTTIKKNRKERNGMKICRTIDSRFALITDKCFNRLAHSTVRFLVFINSNLLLLCNSHITVRVYVHVLSNKGTYNILLFTQSINFHVRAFVPVYSRNDNTTSL